MFISFFITSVLGAIRNFVKYKKFNIYLFIRSPLISLIIYKLLPSNLEHKLISSLILERWALLLFKSIISLKQNDYHIKKEKYIKKYNLKY